MLRIRDAIGCDRSCGGSVLSKTRREDSNLTRRQSFVSPHAGAPLAVVGPKLSVTTVSQQFPVRLVADTRWIRNPCGGVQRTLP
jgi:hypothetical protein